MHPVRMDNGNFKIEAAYLAEHFKIDPAQVPDLLLHATAEAPQYKIKSNKSEHIGADQTSRLTPPPGAIETKVIARCPRKPISFARGAASLSDADDRVRLDHWMAPQQGIAPQIRIGQRWFNSLWALPIGAAALLCLIAMAQSLRELPTVAAFIQNNPGIAQSAPTVISGFPWWLQLQHFLNVFFMLFIMRAGLQILADHTRLYWGRDCTPGSDWFRFIEAGTVSTSAVITPPTRVRTKGSTRYSRTM